MTQTYPAWDLKILLKCFVVEFEKNTFVSIR